jgi:hypothetical protein
MELNKDELAKAYDEQIGELRQKLAIWQLHMGEARPTGGANLQDLIDDANRQIMDLEARKSIALGETP